MEKNIKLDGECLWIHLKNCSYTEFLEVIGKIDLPNDATMSSVMFGELKEGHLTIRCKSTNVLEELKNKLS